MLIFYYQIIILIVIQIFIKQLPGDSLINFYPPLTFFTKFLNKFAQKKQTGNVLKFFSCIFNHGKNRVIIFWWNRHHEMNFNKRKTYGNSSEATYYIASKAWLPFSIFLSSFISVIFLLHQLFARMNVSMKYNRWFDIALY